ncbi:MAG: radical SAM protein [Desulfobulbus sp.]|nr:MAG: radical SAM protein [Desulfobulbus sp.]
MKVVLISMPDVVPIIIHDTAFHLPSLGIASIGGNIDDEHEVFLIDLIRKRRAIKKYLRKTLIKIQPGLVGLSAMAWQYDTCLKIARLIKEILPQVRIVIGGYHATLMAEEIAVSGDLHAVDFMIRGEGEEPCRQLVNSLARGESFAEVESLSWKDEHGWHHNKRGRAADLATLKLPVRDRRRLTSGYHFIYHKIEVLETSRGCTRSCNFCSMKHMYGRTFRTYPISRVLEDLDAIYYRQKVRWVFIVDDNMVLSPKRVIELCDAIIARNYKGLHLMVQADCISIAQNEDMVRKMVEAGFCSVFLGIENVSKENLATAGKGNIRNSSQKAVDICHKYGLMVLAGLIFGFPDDDEESIIANYQFYKELGADAAYCQILTPYPKTEMRESLRAEGLVTNPSDLRKYNGLWANVRTRHLEADKLQYLFWYHRQRVLGFWNPDKRTRSQGKIWISIWRFAFQPFLKWRYKKMMKKIGWKGRYQREVKRWENLNTFKDLEGY